MSALCTLFFSYSPSDPCFYDPDLHTEAFSALSESQLLLNILPPVTVRRLSCHAVTPVWQVFIPPQEAQSSSAAAGEEEGSPLWIFCIINYLRDATSCYLHWTDGNAVQSCSGEHKTMCTAP